eukprot:2423033-Ditylum_brightwellii.AAC.1
MSTARVFLKQKFTSKKALNIVGEEAMPGKAKKESRAQLRRNKLRGNKTLTMKKIQKIQDANTTAKATKEEEKSGIVEGMKEGNDEVCLNNAKDDIQLFAAEKEN